MRSHLSLAVLAVFLVATVCGCAGTRQATGEYQPVGANREVPEPDVQSPSSRIQQVQFQESSPDELNDDLPMLELGDDLADAALPMSHDEITLEALQQLALSNNPTILQGSSAAHKAASIRTQVGLRANPTVGYFGEEIGNDGAAGLHGAFVSQTFVRGNKLALNQEVVGHEEQAVLWQVEASRQRVLTDVQIRFYRALAAQERIRLAEEFLTVAQAGVSVAEERLEAEVGSRPDVLQSEIQVSEVELAIRQAEVQFSAAWNELVAIAGVPEMSQQELVGSLEVDAGKRDRDQIVAEIEAASPAVRSAEAQIRRATSNLRRQESQAIPNVTAQLGIGYDDGTDDGFANIQVGLPVPLHNRNEGNIAAAQAELCEAQHNLRRLRMQIRERLAAVLRDFDSAQAAVDRYKSTILPKARQTLELVLEAQEAGEADFLRVLTARRAIFDANQNYVSAMAQLAKAKAELDGLLLTGALSRAATYEGSDELRGQALSGQ